MWVKTRHQNCLGTKRSWPEVQEIKKTGLKMEKFLGDLNCEPSVIYTHQDFVSLKDNHCIHCLFEFLFKFLWAVSFFPRPQSIYKLDMAPTHFNLIMFSVEKAMAPHSSTLAWKIPWTEEPGGLQSMGSRRVRHDWATSLSLSCIGEGHGNPLQCSCLENPRDGGAWWAAVYGVAESRTRLKRVSSSSSSSQKDLPQLLFWVP